MPQRRHQHRRGRVSLDGGRQQDLTLEPREQGVLEAQHEGGETAGVRPKGKSTGLSLL